MPVALFLFLAAVVNRGLSPIYDRALGRIMVELIADHTDLFKLFSDNPSFKKWLGDAVFGKTYLPPDVQS